MSLVGPRNDPKLADVIDRLQIQQPRGHLIVGGVSRGFYDGEIAWCPCIPQPRGDKWIFKLDEVKINGATVFRDQWALIDTGSAYIVVSPPTYARVKEAIPGSEEIAEKKDNTMFSFPEKSLESIEFLFERRSLPLRRKDFGLGGIKDKKGRLCSSIVGLPGDVGTKTFRGMEKLWIIGGIFLDNNVVIFDYEDKRVGFATIAREETKLIKLKQNVIDTQL